VRRAVVKVVHFSGAAAVCQSSASSQWPALACRRHHIQHLIHHRSPCHQLAVWSFTAQLLAIAQLVRLLGSHHQDRTPSSHIFQILSTSATRHLALQPRRTISTLVVSDIPLEWTNLKCSWREICNCQG